jgi:hypothetical protein
MSRRPRRHRDRGRPFFLGLRSKYLLTIGAAVHLRMCQRTGPQTLVSFSDYVVQTAIRSGDW